MKKILFTLSMFLSMTVQMYVFANATNIQMANNSNGDVATVWETYDGVSFNLAYSMLPNGGTWSSPVSIGDPSQTEKDPLIAINSLGNVVIVWSAVNSTINAIYMVQYDGVSWSAVTQVTASDETIITGKSSYSLRFDDSDWLVITWSAYSLTLSDNIVRSSFGTFGSPLSGPVTLG